MIDEILALRKFHVNVKRRFQNENNDGKENRLERQMKMWMLENDTREQCKRLLEPFVGAESAPRTARYFAALLYLDTQKVLRAEDPHDKLLLRMIDKTKSTWLMPPPQGGAEQVIASLSEFCATYKVWVKRDDKETLRHLICMAIKKPPNDPEYLELKRLITHIGGQRAYELVRLFRENRSSIFRRVANDVEQVCQRAFYDVMQEEVASGCFVRLFSFLCDIRTRLISCSDVDSEHIKDMFDVDYLRMRQVNGTLDSASIRRCFQQVLDLVDTPTDATVRTQLEVGDPLAHLVPFARYLASRVVQLTSSKRLL